MKKQSILPLIGLMSLLILSFCSLSAMACPIDVKVLLDSTSVTSAYNQTEQSPLTVHGSIEYPAYSLDDKVNLSISITPTTKWSTVTKIDGNIVHNGDMIVLTRGQILSLEVTVVAISDEVGTESYSVGFFYGSKCMVGGQLLSLITTKTNPTAAVSATLRTPTVTISPNPAGSYISAHGLNDQERYRYELFSISGVQVRQGILSAGARITVEDIPSGVYRLLLFDAQRILATTAVTVIH